MIPKSHEDEILQIAYQLNAVDRFCRRQVAKKSESEELEAVTKFLDS